MWSSFCGLLRLHTRLRWAGEERGPGRAKRVYRQSLEAGRSPALASFSQAKEACVLI